MWPVTGMGCPAGIVPGKVPVAKILIGMIPVALNSYRDGIPVAVKNSPGCPFGEDRRFSI